MSIAIPLLSSHISMASTGRIFTTSLPLCLQNLSRFIIIHFPKLSPRLKVNFTKIPRGHFLRAFSNIHLCISFLVLNVASHTKLSPSIPPYLFIPSSSNKVPINYLAAHYHTDTQTNTALAQHCTHAERKYNYARVNF